MVHSTSTSVYAAFCEKPEKKHEKKKRGKYVYLLNQNSHKMRPVPIKMMLNLLLEPVYRHSKPTPFSDTALWNSLLKIYQMSDDINNFILSFLFHLLT